MRKSLIAPMIGPPYLGERIWSWTRMSMSASERDSSLCGTCRFISSPSKSALYGGQTDGWSLKVLKGRTLTVCAITDMRWSDGCLLKRTMSPSIRCLSTMNPGAMESASAFLSLAKSSLILTPSGRMT